MTNKIVKHSRPNKDLCWKRSSNTSQELFEKFDFFTFSDKLEPTAI